MLAGWTVAFIVPKTQARIDIVYGFSTRCDPFIPFESWFLVLAFIPVGEKMCGNVKVFPKRIQQGYAAGVWSQCKSKLTPIPSIRNSKLTQAKIENRRFSGKFSPRK
jgi:hypothetical protein